MNGCDVAPQQIDLEWQVQMFRGPGYRCLDQSISFHSQLLL